MSAHPKEKPQTWNLFLTRPFSILGTSLWNSWYQSEYFEEVTGFTMKHGVFFGTPVSAGITDTSSANLLANSLNKKQEYLVRCFRTKEELDRMKLALAHILQSNPEKALEFLELAKVVHSAELRLESTQPTDREELKKNLQFEYDSLEEVCDMYSTIGIFTGLLPYFWLGQCTSENVDLRSRIQTLCTEFRATTLYPHFFDNVILSYFEAYTGTLAEDLNLFTYTEICQAQERGGITSEEIATRKEKIKNSDFIYTYDSGAETLEFVTRAEAVRRTVFFEGGEEDSVLQDTTPPRPKVLKGVVVSKGDGKPVRGIARVVTGTDISGVVFNQGDILVTINSSPVYLPLIRKAGALISEEGGAGCHTAVVAREGVKLNKVTVMGVKNLLSTISNGDELCVTPENATVVVI